MFITVESNLLWLNSIRTRLYLFFGRHSPTSSGAYLLCDEPLIIISYWKGEVISGWLLADFKSKRSKWNQSEKWRHALGAQTSLLWAMKWMWLIPKEFHRSKKLTDFLAFHTRNSTFRCGLTTLKIPWHQPTELSVYSTSLKGSSNPFWLASHILYESRPLNTGNRGHLRWRVWYIGSCVRQLAEFATVPISCYSTSAFSSKTTLLPELTE